MSGYMSLTPEITALRLIDRFSQSSPPTPSASSPWHPLLDQPSIEALQQEIASHPGLFDYPDKVEQHSGFRYLTHGHHFSILSHKNHADVVFKFMTNEDALAQHQTNRKIHAFAIAQDRFWVRVPVSTIVPLPSLPSHSLYVEERLNLGMNMDQHAEFWARIFLYAQSPQANEQFHENLQLLVNNVSDIVLNFSFWDAGLHNLPEASLDGQYLCGVDFEKISDTPNTIDIADGMDRLMSVFALPELRDILIKKAEGLEGFISDLSHYQERPVQQEMKRLGTFVYNDELLQAFSSSPLEGAIRIITDSCMKQHSVEALRGDASDWLQIEEVHPRALTLGVLIDSCQAHLPTLFRERFPGLEKSCYPFAEILSNAYANEPVKPGQCRQNRTALIDLIEKTVSEKFPTASSEVSRLATLRRRLFIEGYQLNLVPYQPTITVNEFEGVIDALNGDFGTVHQLADGKAHWDVKHPWTTPEGKILVGEEAKEHFAAL